MHAGKWSCLLVLAWLFTALRSGYLGKETVVMTYLTNKSKEKLNIVNGSWAFGCSGSFGESELLGLVHWES